MIVLGIGLVWAGYTVGFYGYCLVKGYNVKFSQLVSPTGYYKGNWPPPVNIPGDTIFPNGQTGTGTSTTTTPSQMPPGPTIPTPKSGKCPPGTVPDGKGNCITKPPPVQ